MLALPTYSTPETESLCKEIAKKTNGVCFLGFSRGKDSVCAWLYLKKFFKTVIPFHCCLVPKLRFSEQALKYYEYEFDTHILRMQDSSLHADLRRMVYQYGMDERFIDNYGFYDYDKHDIMDLLRKVYALPNAWCAFGINASDSIERRIYVQNIQGKNPNHKTFYPCWNWPHDKIIETCKESGLKLAPEYNFVNRSIAGMPSVYWLQQLRDNYPDDYKKVEDWYPLCWASILRMEFRDLLVEKDGGEGKKKASGKKKKKTETEASEDGGAE